MMQKTAARRKPGNQPRSRVASAGQRYRTISASRAEMRGQCVQCVDAAGLPRSAVPCDWDAKAGAWARTAWERDCARRNGLYLVRGDERGRAYLVIYNNHPHAGFPLLRDQELTEIRRRLNAAGVTELAYAVYPHPREGFTYAVVLGVGAGWEARVERLVNEAADVCWSRRVHTAPR
jgi:hypothetical protein